MKAFFSSPSQTRWQAWAGPRRWALLSFWLALFASYAQAQTACFTAWSATATYTGGMQVSRSGNNYTAKWWTQNEDPVTKSCTDCAWRLVGPCGTGTPNTAPTVGLTAPAGGATFTAPASIALTANAADADGTVSKVEFYQGSTLLGTDTSSPYAYTWTSVAAGTYALTAKATDNAGAVTTSATVSVTVSTGPAAQAVPGKIEAESFTAQSGTQTETTTDTGGGLNVGYLDAGDYLDYAVSVTTAGSYTVGFRVASLSGGGQAQLRNAAGATLGSIAVAATNGWQAWTTVSTTVALAAGAQTLRVYVVAGGWNLNYLTFATGNPPANTPPTVSLTSPAAGASFTAPAAITLSANAADADGTIAQVAFYNGTTLLNTDTSSPYSYVWTGVATGTYAITAKATDNAGATTTSAAVSVTVTGGTTTSPGLPKRIMSGYWHSWNGGVPFIKLRDVNAGWDVINISFAEPVTAGSVDGRMHFVVSGLDATYTTADFKADIKTLQAKGKKIVLSIGGYEGYFSLGSAAAATQFAGDIKAIVNEYGFDGIDIDLEQSSITFNGGADPDFKNPTSPKVVNMIAGIRQVLAAYPSTFILSWAPETFYLQLGHQYYAGTNANVDARAGNYIPMIYALRSQTTYVQAQLYNSGQVQGNDGMLYSMGNTAAVAAMTEMLVQGFTVGGPTGPLFPALRPDQVVIGVPASASAAGSGQLSNADLQAAFNRVNANYPGLRGIMSWSINWDAYQNANSFVSANSAFLKGLPAARMVAASAAPASLLTISERSAYPNPALAGQRLAVDLGGRCQTAQVTVTDLTGRTVATYVFHDVSQAELALPAGRTGVLLLHIVADGQTFTKRLTVN